MKKIQIIFLVLIILAVGFFLYYKEATLPFDKSSKTSKIFVISPGQSLQSIANALSKEDLIRDRLIFFLVVKQMGLDRKIQAGDFRLSPSMDTFEIAKTLTHGTLDVWVTLIEGTRKEEMAQVIGQSLDIPEVEFDKYGNEGYLFPDTYLMPKDATAGSVINILQNNFKVKFTPDMKMSALKEGLTENQAVILASIVEKEARTDVDRPIVAGILLKRLREDWPLQVDASIQYALGYQPDEKSWWKKYLSVDDLKIDSPYNTYTNKGLPPTPICNPGLSSIKAVVNADINTPYWYYMSDKNGKMHYAKTIEEHNANVQRYLQ